MTIKSELLTTLVEEIAQEWNLIFAGEIYARV